MTRLGYFFSLCQGKYMALDAYCAKYRISFQNVEVAGPLLCVGARGRYFTGKPPETYIKLGEHTNSTADLVKIQQHAQTMEISNNISTN